MALKTTDLQPGEESLLVQIKGQMESNRKSHEEYVKARDKGDQAGMDLNQHGFQAFEAYAQQYRDEAARLGVKGEPDADDIPLSATMPGDRDIGKVPDKPDKEFKGPVPGR